MPSYGVRIFPLQLKVQTKRAFDLIHESPDAKKFKFYNIGIGDAKTV